jgi:hypothetical protein
MVADTCKGTRSVCEKQTAGGKKRTMHIVATDPLVSEVLFGCCRRAASSAAHPR